MRKRTEENDRKIVAKDGKRQIFRAGIALLIVAILLIGFTYAWFINRNDMATLMQIREPSDISILGPDGNPLESLDLSYQPGDKTENTVTIRKVFCVQSQTNYKLEIAHTTNLKGLTFTLYPAKKTDTNSTVTDKGIGFTYDSAEIEGSYINLDNDQTNNDYKYANTNQHAKNYSEYNKVQMHAEPAYWLASGIQTVPNENDASTTGTEMVTIDKKTYYRNYYVCEITWTETEKETDIFYILAQSAA